MNPCIFLLAAGATIQAPDCAETTWVRVAHQDGFFDMYVMHGNSLFVPRSEFPVYVEITTIDNCEPWQFTRVDGHVDLDLDESEGTDADIELFFTELARGCCSADFDHDGVPGTTEDVMLFFRCLAGNCDQ